MTLNIRLDVVSDSISSCYMEIGDTSLVCSIYLQEKLEKEPNFELTYNTFEGKDIPFSNLLAQSINNLLVDRLETTLVKVNFFVFKNDENTFSACVNAFSICILRSGLRINDVLSACMVVVPGPAQINCVYRNGGRCFSQLFVAGLVENLGKFIPFCVEECKKKCEEIKEVIKNELKSI
ncbi:putative exosome complex component RRP41 [Astathelohania contejeani]|uniref:Exosome complex component RRP41 n=1 Tax=Astathelohania contejeani TaxID=164912 RepID=A0ABQ7HYG4_9MICR|nr:putative exosome complex component RRP41 [Thelohania contejeani]